MRASRVLIGLALLAGCARNPVTGEREFVLISESQEIAMGQQAAEEVEQSLGLVQDEELQAYVRRIGQRMAAASERPQLPWRFGVVDDPVPNAFALPGGPIYMTRGMMGLMDSEAELAGVLGHEIGHITARHSVTQISRAQLAQLGLGIGMILAPELQAFGGALSTGLQLLFLKYGRDDERQSDELGFRYSLQSGYDVREFDDIFASLRRISARETEGEGSGLPSFLSSHPDPGERVETAQRRVAALTTPPPDHAGKAEYLAQVDGLVYGENPRQGFFRGGIFLHPDLRFQLRFPSGWRTQNMTQAVVASSPEQDGAAQLTFAQGTPEEAARAFLSQAGMLPGAVQNVSINGKPAVSGTFQTQTSNGVVAGRVTYVSHGGATYQLLAYTVGSRFASYDPIFRTMAESFATLTDASALNVQPNRIRVVQLPSAMSLTEFNRRYPSTIPIEELSVINQVEDVNARLPAGTRLKQVRAG